MTGKTQSYARQVNNRLIMREIRKSGKCSATMLAEKLNLSNAALTAILFALQQKGYISRAEEISSDKRLGRRPVYYSVNSKMGCVAVLQFADKTSRLVVADMSETVLYDAAFSAEKYDLAALYGLVIALKDALHSDILSGVPLLAVEVSVAGRVDAQTGRLQFSPQFDADLLCGRNALADVLKKHFDVPVSVNNDVNLALCGEMSFGVLRNVQNALYVHLDEGIGGAFVLNGKPYFGQNGFAGEIGLLHASYNGSVRLLDDCVSLRAVKNMLTDGFSPCHRFEDVSALFDSDIGVRGAVLDTARVLGAALRDVVELLDISAIVLSGRLSQLDGYVESVAEAVGDPVARVEVVRSAIADASVSGAVSKAVDELTDGLFD